MPTLTKIDASCNRYRFYTVQVCRNLFGEWSLVREWGRIGSPGRLRCDTYDTESAATDAEQRCIKRRLRRGYTERNAE